MEVVVYVETENSFRFLSFFFFFSCALNPIIMGSPRIWRFHYSKRARRRRRTNFFPVPWIIHLFHRCSIQ